MPLTKIDPLSLTMRPFQDLDQGWALLSAGQKGSFNMMTVSWGGLGTLWYKPVTTVYVRPQRYTREFIERESCYTLSFFDHAYRQDLALLGRKSGREEDKLSQTKLSVQFDSETGAPIYAQASLTFVCRKLYADDIDPDHFLDPAVIERSYPNRDFHRMYIGEILSAYRKA